MFAGDATASGYLMVTQIYNTPLQALLIWAGHDTLYNNAGTWAQLATVNNGVLNTSGAGVPSISTTLPRTAPILTVTTP
jgi:hypothetical protein